jgi:Spy/CpxP family protein refolding chaperone
MTMNKPWQVWLVLAAIFIAGGVSGGLVGFRAARRWRLPPPPPNGEAWMAQRMQRVVQTLDLSAEQKARVEAIVKRDWAELDKLRHQSFHASHEILERMESEIQNELNAEQKAKFAEIHKQWQESRKRMQERFMRGERPGGGPARGMRPPPDGEPPQGPVPPPPAPNGPPPGT